MMPRFDTFSRLIRSLSSCCGVILIQSLAQRSAPKTAIPCACRKLRVAGVDSKPGNRKNGVVGVVVAPPCSANSTAEMPCSISSVVSLGLIRIRLRCNQVWCPMVWPSAAIRRTRSGCSEAGLPIRKNVARTHSRASSASTFDVVGAHGPSSKVKTTSWSPSGKVCGKVFKPTCGYWAGSTLRIRDVPSAPACGHSAVRAGAMQANRIVSAAHAAPVGFRIGRAPDIFGIALAVADWVMPATQLRPVEAFCQTARRAMAEHVEVAPPAEASVLERFLLRGEDGEIRRDFVDEIARRIEATDATFLREVVAELHEADLGDVIAALAPDNRVRLVELTGTDFDFSALNEVDDTVREEILEELEPETVAEGVRELESDDAVELLEALDAADQEVILEKLPPQERDALERSLDYPENSAGRRMQTDFICVPPGWTVGRAIDYLRDRSDLPDRFYEIYAVDGARKWQGAIPLDLLLRSRRSVPLADLIDAERHRVSVTDDLEEVARLFGKYNLVAAPVVDGNDRLVGVITVDDVVDVIEEEADEEIKALGGVTSDEELSDNFWTI